jgi:hypothetical protein
MWERRVRLLLDNIYACKLGPSKMTPPDVFRKGQTLEKLRQTDSFTLISARLSSC